MRSLILLLCSPAYVCAAQLVPPSGFTNPLPHAEAGQCLDLPAPYTSPLEFRSKYEGSDSARATLNPQAEKAFREETLSITDFERGISQMIWRYKRSGDPQTLSCIVTGYQRWADANALTSRRANHTGRSMRKWALATLATGWLELKFMPGKPLKAPLSVDRWLGRLADQTIADWDGLPLEKTNNHSYWAAWSVMATSVALNRRDLFDWSVKEYRIAAGQIGANGTLPNERKRRARAVAYHNYALQPLVMIASFAQANHVDLLAENNHALQRLASYVLRNDRQDRQWLEPYCTLVKCDSVTQSLRDAARPLKNRRLGGDLTALYQP